MGKAWLKLWTETIADRKLRRVSPEARWCWVGVLCLAAERDDNGKLELSAGVCMTDADIADAIGVSIDTWRDASRYFLNLGMLTQVEDCYIVTNYAKRQAGKDVTAAERMRRMRERNIDEPVAPVTRNVTRNRGRMLRVEAEAEAEAEAERSSLHPVHAAVYAHFREQGWALSEAGRKRLSTLIATYGAGTVDKQITAIAERKGSVTSPLPYMEKVLADKPTAVSSEPIELAGWDL